MTHDTTTSPAAWLQGLALLALLMSACGGGDDDAAVADAGPAADASGDRATEYLANRAGWVEIVENAATGARLSAALRDATDVPPASLLASQGECEVWTHPLEPATCEPACTDGVCVATDECRPFPQPASAGTIDVTGLSQPVSFTPGDFGYQSDPDVPPEDLFDDLAAISATAPGADAPGFTLEASGVVPLDAALDLDFDTTLVLEDGVDEEIAWTAASSGLVQIGLQVGWHGAPYEALLVCESADDGALTIPGALIAELPRASSGLEQHPSWMARVARDRVDTAAGPVELVVGSELLILQLDHQ